MSCCGKARATPPVAIPTRTAAAPAPPPAARAATVAVFRYDGPTQLTVFGRNTGARYWFARPGAEMAVDLRDRASLQKVPQLREVRLG